MKRSLIIAAAGLLAVAMLTGCSALDGRPDTYEGADGAVTDNSGSGMTTTTSATSVTTERVTSRYGTNSASDERTRSDRTDRNEGAGEKVSRKADEITDDVADGINGGLNATESIVDDVLR